MVKRLFADVIHDAIWFMNIHEKIPLWSLFLNVYLHLQWNAVLTQIMLCLAEAVLRNIFFLREPLLNLY
jgi:hypothetical protein